MTESGFSTTLSEVLADFEPVPSTRYLRDQIDRLPISADAKSIIMDLAKISIEIGGKILAFGRKLIAFVLELAEKFQNVVFGILIAMAVSAVLATLPLLGPAISTLLTPLLIALGIAKGAIEDFKNMSVQREIDALKQRMSILSAHA